MLSGAHMRNQTDDTARWGQSIAWPMHILFGLCNVQAVLLVGYMQHEVEEFRSFMIHDLEADMVKVSQGPSAFLACHMTTCCAGHACSMTCVSQTTI